MSEDAARVPQAVFEVDSWEEEEVVEAERTEVLELRLHRRREEFRTRAFLDEYAEEVLVEDDPAAIDCWRRWLARLRMDTHFSRGWTSDAKPYARKGSSELHCCVRRVVECTISLSRIFSCH